ncbi:tetratricopeptide repeat protein [Thalassotalea euphylliae]|uniref:tetratricopeptide repeat protein n=1 Tax=Thalassotalea euphylliae TaxID=1655234 RepID=UPI0015F29D9D|nr:tetratricopeptide repeat protein [Thalassotalea euphylliae]
MRPFITFLILLLGLVAITQAQSIRDNKTCGINPGKPLRNAYGPFDYTNPSHASKLPLVITAHFTADVRTLKRGTTNRTPHGDIDYTLRAIPNYHPALHAITKLEARDRRALKEWEIFTPSHYSTKCYFERAIYFQPNDATTHMLYAMYLHSIEKDAKSAEQMYERALAKQPNHTELHYNMGLFYISIGDLEKAEYHAKVAYQNKYPLPGLKNKLAKAKTAK